MSRRAVAVLTVIVFAVFSVSCMTWRNKEIRTSADYPRPNKEVVRVVMRSGEVIRFSRAAPARIVGGQVVGTLASLMERSAAEDGAYAVPPPSTARTAPVT